MSTRPATLVRITGRVQGVGFRLWTREEAEALGLCGWVRNEPEGSVSALLAGSPEAVAEMIRKLRAGPPGAKVTSVAAEPADAGSAENNFRIQR